MVAFESYPELNPERVAEITNDSIRAAVDEYVRMSGLGPYATHEFVFQLKIAENLYRRLPLYVALEISEKTLREWDGDASLHKGDEPESVDKPKDGYTDLTLFQNSENPKNAKLWGLMEVKRTWVNGVVKDAGRLVNVAKKLNSVEYLFVATCIQAASCDERRKYKCTTVRALEENEFLSQSCFKYTEWEINLPPNGRGREIIYCAGLTLWHRWIRRSSH